MIKMKNKGGKSTKLIEHGKTNPIMKIRNVIFLLIGLLTAQFWLGMTINLEVNIPVKHLGAIQSLIYFGSRFDFVLAHIIIGFAILLTSLVFLILGFKTQLLSLRVCAIVVPAGVIGAIINGILFLMSGQFFGWSIGMAMSAVSILIVSAISLYFIGENIENELA
ncbi:MAG: hypothetical protein JRN32_03340 [Nitrososphaerota archaeon]|jgi:hypothetical protein|nr:hypothetical protein [Nitrososphaerota archaeon]MDG7043129.1 hypothetical protein [Nitrososphaerota archaeon]MDG7045834.1 hypothetical protein [Nitrososphaerota archaeon]